MISLLYSDVECINAPAISSQVSEQLMLCDAIALILPENDLREYFLDTVSKPLIEKEDIKYRQDILKDFLGHRELLTMLDSLLSRFVGAVLDYNGSKIGKKQKLGRVSVDSGVSELCSVSALITELLFLIKKMYAEIKNLSLGSQGLVSFRERLGAIVLSDGYEKLISIAKRYEAPGLFHADISFALNEKAQLTKIKCLLSEKKSDVTVKQEKKKTPLFKRRTEKNESEAYTESIQLSYNSFAVEKIVGQAVSDITGAMVNVINTLIADFIGLKDELMFYKASCRIVDRFDDLGIKYSFPSFANKTEFLRLYDLFLLFRRSEEIEVIPNDFCFSDKTAGILISGDNGGGKTVYLRSVANAYLFAQAGLPVAAEISSLMPVRAIDVFMASYENTLGISESAGRFEEEVIKISEIADAPKENSIVMLNEFFQTTSYSEGAKGLYHILNYFSYRSVLWICVTHLTELLDMYKNDADISMVKVIDHKAKIIKNSS